MMFRLKVNGKKIDQAEHDHPGIGVDWAYHAMLKAGHNLGVVETENVDGQWVTLAKLEKPDDTPPPKVAAPWNPDTV